MVVTRGWGCKRGRLVESDSVIFFSLFGYVRPVLTRTAPIDLGPFSVPQGELKLNVDDEDDVTLLP